MRTIVIDSAFLLSTAINKSVIINWFVLRGSCNQIGELCAFMVVYLRSSVVQEILCCHLTDCWNLLCCHLTDCWNVLCCHLTDGGNVLRTTNSRAHYAVKHLAFRFSLFVAIYCNIFSKDIQYIF